MAMAIGAMPWGQWSGCHATPISADWGNFAPRELTDRSNRLSYPYGVMINRRGRRFVDEGEDGAMFTYAKYGRAFDPTQKDGLATSGLAIEKTNWATKLENPPYYAYSATGGITFTFGGLRIDENTQVIGTDWRPIGGLFACGEMVGGLFYDNYPAGTGLVSGATFGRIAGRTAAQLSSASRAMMGAAA
jgi:succinate dehydrogenase/fumarate reductase flavoprotein subunit